MSDACIDLPVLRPRLPRAEALLPWLKRIDEAGWYTNAGPLHNKLRQRMAAHFGLEPDCVTLTANGTLGLTLALQAQRPPAGSYCLMPSWTFVATAHAVRQAGLKPFFVDVEPETWALSPTSALLQAAGAPGPVGAVAVVAPFGAPLDLGAWDRFQEASGLAVVVDAAAGFDSLKPGRVPAMVSLHATKALGIGEGGLIVTEDAALSAEIGARSRFGFRGERLATVDATNAKLSEYAAAVGLAALDAWPETREAWIALRRLYEKALGGLRGLQFAPGLSGVAASTMMVTGRGDAADMAEDLADQGIGSQFWWGSGCHRHPPFRDCPRAALPFTESLAERSLGLPFHLDMGEAEVERVAAALGRAQRRVAA
ncbi:dTDP-4-amino-4,6-dideoxygalactose transaminase [Tistlia consotensis]|uniref:dTDP-4-amino-4,6-dideoxygalactose transaminase n=1 Tax=Tistlia consotensis USBA 355 TaxID=560819 RepID=A0A1Y6BQR0_9PROT|nr:DegT/DnrJ/EryC1/StrS family aminotransferase [Tistlia consotensis]SMF13446.1 dTDP-4-amino-4,6-dideoxygalactose transaminase [Tistlia consotensis USBA 355]SNR50488.1 dTDP-4-amino-4,6-dideoxygalactose transaminase [Tistlia consotensis]